MAGEKLDVIEGDKEPDFTVDGKSFEICYTQKRIDLYEASHKPIMAAFMQNGGAFSRAELEALLAYGLRYEGGGYVNPKQGQEMAGELIRENGYAAVFERVAEALQRDCGFLFV